jgi:hypothetical protein
MSSPNIKFASSNSSKATATAASTKVIHIGKEQQPLTVPVFANVSDPTWVKRTCFQQFVSVLQNHSSMHSVPDLVSILANELPIDTGASYQEAVSVMNSIQDSIWDIDHLVPLGFLNSYGKHVAVNAVEAAARPADVSFVRLRCALDPGSFDSRIGDVPFAITFCLRLPQQSYRQGTGIVTDVTRTDSAPAPRELFPDAVDRGDNDDGTPALATTTPVRLPVDQGGRDDIVSPKMSMFLSSNTDDQDTDGAVTRGYYGTLAFVDEQSIFDTIFGLKPALLPHFPVSAPNSLEVTVKEQLDAFAYKCLFNVFVAVCRDDYVGSSDECTALSIQDTARRIGSLRQVYRVNNKTIMDSPDILFSKFIQQVPTLPDDAGTWPINLASMYFSALTQEITDRMCLDGFNMPSLVGLESKRKQLNVLRTVRQAAAASFKLVEDDKARMQQMIKSMNLQHARPPSPARHIAAAAAMVDHRPSHPTGSVNWQSDSQAEQTLKKYQAPEIGVGNKPKQQTSFNPGTQQHHPIDPVSGYVSKFPVGFRGCYNCGKEGHYNRNDCGVVKTRENSTAFWYEMWCHRPDTRRRQVRQRLASVVCFIDVVGSCIELFRYRHNYTFRPITRIRPNIRFRPIIRSRPNIRFRPTLTIISTHFRSWFSIRF